MPETERFRDLRQEAEEGFDRALAEVTAQLAAVPTVVTLRLPGFEPDTDSTKEPSPEQSKRAVPPTASTHRNPLQEQLNLGFLPNSEGLDDADDPISAFAPHSGINWGPRRLKLTHRSDSPPEADF
jgi:hypothetical protein